MTVDLTPPPFALYVSNGGVVACNQSPRCIGSYAFFDLQAQPDLTDFVTPLDAWQRATAEDDAEWQSHFDGAHMHCETCGAEYGSQR